MDIVQCIAVILPRRKRLFTIVDQMQIAWDMDLKDLDQLRNFSISMEWTFTYADTRTLTRGRTLSMRTKCLELMPVRMPPFTSSLDLLVVPKDLKSQSFLNDASYWLWLLGLLDQTVTWCNFILLHCLFVTKVLGLHLDPQRMDLADCRWWMKLPFIGNTSWVLDKLQMTCGSLRQHTLDFLIDKFVKCFAVHYCNHKLVLKKKSTGTDWALRVPFTGVAFLNFVAPQDFSPMTARNFRSRDVTKSQRNSLLETDNIATAQTNMNRAALAIPVCFFVCALVLVGIWVGLYYSVNDPGYGSEGECPFFVMCRLLPCCRDRAECVRWRCHTAEWDGFLGHHLVQIWLAHQRKRWLLDRSQSLHSEWKLSWSYHLLLIRQTHASLF